MTPLVHRFSEIGNLVSRPRPPVGSNHKLWIWVGNRRFRAVIDTGASVTTIPESIALDIINMCQSMDAGDPDYPIVDLCRYNEVTKLQGFAAGNVVLVRFGCVLKTMFRDVAGRTVTFPIEYRVIPEEVDTGRMILLGARTVGPDGLDVRTTTFHHELTKCGLKCERLEFLSRPLTWWRTCSGSPSWRTLRSLSPKATARRCAVALRDPSGPGPLAELVGWTNQLSCRVQKTEPRREPAGVGSGRWRRVARSRSWRAWRRRRTASSPSS